MPRNDKRPAALGDVHVIVGSHAKASEFLVLSAHYWLDFVNNLTILVHSLQLVLIPDKLVALILLCARGTFIFGFILISVDGFVLITSIE